MKLYTYNNRHKKGSGCKCVAMRARPVGKEPFTWMRKSACRSRLKSMSAMILLTLGKGWALRPDTSNARSAMSYSGEREQRPQHGVHSGGSRTEGLQYRASPGFIFSRVIRATDWPVRGGWKTSSSRPSRTELWILAVQAEHTVNSGFLTWKGEAKMI